MRLLSWRRTTATFFEVEILTPRRSANCWRRGKPTCRIRDLIELPWWGFPIGQRLHLRTATKLPTVYPHLWASFGAPLWQYTCAPSEDEPLSTLGPFGTFRLSTKGGLVILMQARQLCTAASNKQWWLAALKRLAGMETLKAAALVGKGTVGVHLWQLEAMMDMLDLPAAISANIPKMMLWSFETSFAEKLVRRPSENGYDHPWVPSCQRQLRKITTTWT